MGSLAVPFCMAAVPRTGSVVGSVGTSFESWGLYGVGGGEEQLHMHMCGSPVLVILLCQHSSAKLLLLLCQHSLQTCDAACMDAECLLEACS
jgi:hypothetical protein